MKKQIAGLLTGLLVCSAFLTGCSKNEATEAVKESTEDENEGTGDTKDADSKKDTNRKSDKQDSDKSDEKMCIRDRVKEVPAKGAGKKKNTKDVDTVSYTHLDVYKRQLFQQLHSTDPQCVGAQPESWPGIACQAKLFRLFWTKMRQQIVYQPGGIGLGNSQIATEIIPCGE